MKRIILIVGLVIASAIVHVGAGPSSVFHSKMKTFFYHGLSQLGHIALNNF